MAGLAIVRALSIENSQQPRMGRRVPSSQLIDRMHTIPEDALPSPIPGPYKTMRGYSFTVTESTPLLGEQEDSYAKCYPKNCRFCLQVFLSVMTVFSMVSQVISTPLYTNAMSDANAGSDAFIASFAASFWTPPVFLLLHIAFSALGDAKPLKDIIRPKAPMWLMVVVGLLGGLNNILVAFTSIPARTPAYLQGILHQLLIPFTAIARYFILKRGITRTQFFCIMVQFVGMFVTLEPTIFKMRQTSPVYHAMSLPVEPNPHAWYFYVVYGVAWLPLAFGYVLLEKSQRTHPGRSLAVTAWLQIFQFLSHFVFVPVDFIPDIGMANAGGSSFISKLHNGFQCFYGGRAECADVPKLATLYIVSYASTTVFSVLLIRFTDGAVFTVIVMALVTPISTLFWNLFSATPEFHWAPFFDEATVLVLLGLVIMMPAVILFTYFGSNDQENTEAQQNVQQEEDVTAPKVTPPLAKPTPLKRYRRRSDPIQVVGVGLQRPPRIRAHSETPVVVPYKRPDEVPLRYRSELPPRRNLSLGFLAPIQDREKKQRQIKALKKTLKDNKSSQMKRVHSAPVLMGGF